MQQKKYRDKTGLFVAEGPKLISELLKEGLRLHSLFTSEEIIENTEKTTGITERELQKISSLKTPNTSLALFEIPEQKPFLTKGLTLALDGIRDPGNLGTIIRLCDWFGIAQLVCSEDTADCYNPKVVQATMGSIARIPVSYVPLGKYLKESGFPVYGGCMDGDNVYEMRLQNNAVLVMGNESSGISEEIQALLNHRITIPRFGPLQKTESLNVSTATAILLSEFRRPTET